DGSPESKRSPGCPGDDPTCGSTAIADGGSDSKNTSTSGVLGAASPEGSGASCGPDSGGGVTIGTSRPSSASLPAAAARASSIVDATRGRCDASGGSSACSASNADSSASGGGIEGGNDSSASAGTSTISPSSKSTDAVTLETGSAGPCGGLSESRSSSRPGGAEVTRTSGTGSASSP